MGSTQFRIVTVTSLILLISIVCGCTNGATSLTNAITNEPTATSQLKSQEAIEATTNEATATTKQTTTLESVAPSTSVPAVETTPEPEPTLTQSVKKVYWPENIPDKVPSFKYGMFDGSKESITEEDGSITQNMYFTEISKDSINDYSRILKDEGYIVARRDSKEEVLLSGVINTNGQVEVFIMVCLRIKTGICTYDLTYQKD